MSAGIVIVTHGKTGEALIEEAEFVIGQAIEGILVVAFNHCKNRDSGAAEIRSALARAGSGDGVLVMTDLPGASPSNLAGGMLEEFQAVMVTGINLAMLISVWNYRDRPLGILVRKAVESGRRGVKIFQQ